MRRAIPVDLSLRNAALALDSSRTALDSIGAVEYDAEVRSISLPPTVTLTVSGPIGANASSVVLLDRLCSAFRLPRSLIIGERGFMPECGVRSPSMDWVASDPARRVAPAAIERLSALIDDGLPAVVAHDARWYAVACRMSRGALPWRHHCGPTAMTTVSEGEPP